MNKIRNGKNMHKGNKFELLILIPKASISIFIRGFQTLYNENLRDTYFPSVRGTRITSYPLNHDESWKSRRSGEKIPDFFFFTPFKVQTSPHLSLILLCNWSI